MNPDIEQLERLYNILLSQKDYPDNYYSAEFEYFRLINKSDFLISRLREVIKKNTLKESTLHNTSNYLFIITTFDANLPPKFLTDEIDKEYHLSTYFLGTLYEVHEENVQKKTKQIQNHSNKEYRPNWTRRNSHDDLLKVQELHIAILAQTSLNDKAIPIEKINFDPIESIFSFGDIKILVSKTKNSRAHQLMSLISTNFSKEWHTDEIVDALNDEYLDGEKIYQAALRINEQIAKGSDIKDLLDASRKKIAVKRQYLK